MLYRKFFGQKYEFSEVGNLVKRALDIGYQVTSFLPEVNVECEIRIPTVPTFTIEKQSWKHITVVHWTSDGHGADIREIFVDGYRLEIISKENVWRYSHNEMIFSVSTERKLINLPYSARRIKERSYDRATIMSDSGILVEINRHSSNTYTLEIEFEQNAQIDIIEGLIKKYTPSWWPLPKPLDVSPGELWREIKNGAFMGAKLDGIRCAILFNNSLKNFVVYGENGRVLKEKKSSNEDIEDNIIDGELMDDGIIWVFDIIRYNKNDVTKETLSKRWEYLKILTCIDYSCIGIEIKFKEFTEFSTFNEFVSTYEKYSKICEKNMKMDGVIIMKDGEYKSPVYKSKKITTVDLMYDNGRLLLKDGTFVGTTHESCINGNIYEFVINKGVVCELVKERTDKLCANSKIPYEGNSVEIICKGMGCHSMRARHNDVKFKLLKWLRKKGSWLLDVGSGHGGDILKWSIFEKVTAVDPLHKMYVGTSNEDTIIDVKYMKIQEYLSFKPNIPNIVSVFFVPDYKVLEYLANSRVHYIATIIMNNPMEIKSDILNVKVTDEVVEIKIPGSKTAENIVEDRHKNNINLKGYEIVHVEEMEHPFMTIPERSMSKSYTACIFKRIKSLC